MNSLGSRRGFFGRSTRRIRGSHMDDSPDMPPPYGFYSGPGEYIQLSLTLYTCSSLSLSLRECSVTGILLRKRKFLALPPA